MIEACICVPEPKHPRLRPFTLQVAMALGRGAELPVNPHVAKQLVCRWVPLVFGGFYQECWVFRIFGIRWDK